MFSNAGAAILGNGNRGMAAQKITLNIEDVLLHEEKLNNIMEVSPNFSSLIFWHRASATTRTHRSRVKTGGT